mmetsp:Transcript_117356/g.373956  ORF Transcript_117356/g.373956 Transcript_117356/m.373956 type:complete len:295 (+) Transcript_117356:1677-2561(+)
MLGEARDLPVSSRLTHTAGLVALIPTRPGGQLAVDSPVAAGVGLVHHPLAGPAPARGRPLDASIAAALAVSAAAGPFAPLVQDAAVQRLLIAILLRTRLHLLEAARALLASVGRLLLYAAAAAVQADTAALAAGFPARPCCQAAGHGIRNVACASLVERCVASDAFVLRLLQHPPLTEALPLLGGVAVRPLAPAREDAVLGLIAERRAGLRRQQLAIAGEATLVVHRRDDPLALAKANARGSRPLAPIAKSAIPRRAGQRAVRRLFTGHGLELCATALRVAGGLEQKIHTRVLR